MRVEQELSAYQQQMTILATLDPDRYRENRRPLSLWQVRTAIIVGGYYYLLPAFHTDSQGQPVLFEQRVLNSPSHVLQINPAGQMCDQSGRVLGVDRTGRVYEAGSGYTRGYLHPLPFQAVRRHVAAIFNQQRQGQAAPARLDDQLIVLRRPEQERTRKMLWAPSTQQELVALKCAPVILNWDEQPAAKPLAELRQAKRGLGDHALTIFRTTGSIVFDQSHIFFDGVWGMALAEILTAEAVAWAAYFSTLPAVEPASQPPFQLRLAYEPALEKFPTMPTSEVSAENTAIDMKALYALRRLLVKRHPDLRPVNTVNDLLILYRCHFGHLYTPSPELEQALARLQTQGSAEALAAYTLAMEMLAKSQANNPSIMLPMDASGLSPRERLHPTTFRNPFTQLWAKYQSTLALLKQYQTYQTQAHWSAFSEARYALLVQLDHFGQLLQAHKRVALEGESPSSAAMRLLAHVPDSLLKLLDEIPRRIDVLNEVIKGEEVFSNVGRVARGSSLSRFISAKDDNENKTLVWGILTDDQEVLHLTLRDFRPHVAALARIGRLDLARFMAAHYLDSFAHGFNEFVAHLLDILNATATHTSKGATE